MAAAIALTLSSLLVLPSAHATEPPAAARLQSASALLTALKQQNADKHGYQAAEISAIEVELQRAETLHARGDSTDAHRLAEATYQRIKAAIAALQTHSSLKSGSAAMDEADRPRNSTPAARPQSANALLVALRQQNTDKHGHQDAEIAAIEAELRRAESLDASGNTTEAARLSEDAYARAKAAIASLQSHSSLKSGSDALAESNRITLDATNTPELREVYARRDAALGALLSAGERVAAEQGSRPGTLAEAATLRTEATAAAALGHYPKGIGALERAYGLAKSALGSMRGGQQLVADKKFATPADEYAYEQQRNEDYQLLITGVVRAASKAEWTKAMESSQLARRNADQAAKAGDWGTAIRQIDESTRQLKNILRQAGFPIV